MVVLSDLPDEIISLILSKMSYATIYRLHLEGNTIYTNYLLDDGKRIISLLEEWIHPDAGYRPIGADFDFTNLELITKQIWNMLTCVSSTADSDIPLQLLYDANDFITMECDVPDSFKNMCSDIWKVIIKEYLDAEYNPGMEWFGGNVKWKYIYRNIEEYPAVHGLDTLAKQKYALSILIMTYLNYKNKIMHLYGAYDVLDTNEKYYLGLKSLIVGVSSNSSLDMVLIPRQFVKDTFYFMSE
jgi:hypothetical protein